MTLPQGPGDSRGLHRHLILLKVGPPMGLENTPNPAPLRTSSFSPPPPGAASAPGPLHRPLPASPPPALSQPTPSCCSGPSSAPCLRAGTTRLPGRVYSITAALAPKEQSLVHGSSCSQVCQLSLPTWPARAETVPYYAHPFKLGTGEHGARVGSCSDFKNPKLSCCPIISAFTNKY